MQYTKFEEDNYVFKILCPYFPIQNNNKNKKKQYKYTV